MHSTRPGERKKEEERREESEKNEKIKEKGKAGGISLGHSMTPFG